MTAAIYAFADFLSSARGFLAICGSIVAGLLLGWPFGFPEMWLLLFNLYLSIAALVIGGAILVSSRRESLAEHAKLDEVIRAIGAARNELIRIEEQPEEEIEARRDGA